MRTYAAFFVSAFGISVVIATVCVLVPAVNAGDCEYTYDNFGKEFMENYCTKCHTSEKSGFTRWGATKGYDFDTQDKIPEQAAEILEWVIDKGDMPPRGKKPTSEEKTGLKAWLDCEYQQESGSATP